MELTPSFKVVANNEDITSILIKNAVSIDFKDDYGSLSDELTISVFGAFKRPKSGDQLKLYLGYKETGLFYCGLFKVTTTERVNNNRLTIKAMGFDITDDKFKEKRNQSYRDLSIYDLVKIIADRNNLKLKCDFKKETKQSDDGSSENIINNIDDIIGSVHINHISQTNQSDASFLKKVAEDYGAIFSIKNDTLIFLVKSLKNRKNEEKTVNFDVKNAQNIAITHSIKTYYGSCKAIWHCTRENGGRSAVVGTGKPQLILNGNFASYSEALIKAQTTLQKANEGLITGRISTIGMEIFAGNNLKLNGSIDSEDNIIYHVKNVTHKIDPSGFFTDIEISN